MKIIEFHSTHALLSIMGKWQPRKTIGIKGAYSNVQKLNDE
jgi:hypothetical protein